MTYNRREQGSVHIIIIICLVLGLVTALGWIYWQNFILKEDKTSSVPVGKTDSNTNEESSAVKPAYDGLRTTSKSGAFSIKIPNGWTMLNDTATDYMTSGPSIDKLVYDAKMAPTITTAEVGGWGGPAETFMIRVSDNVSADWGELESTKFTLDDGTVAERFHTLTKKGTDSQVYGVYSDDYSQYQYVIKKPSTTVVASFASYAQTNFDLKLIENVVSSIQIAT